MQLKKTLLKSNRLTKQIIVATSDFLLFILSLWITLSISLNALYAPSLQEGLSLFLSPLLGVLIFYLSGIYRSVVRYINLVGILVIVRTLGVLVVLDLCLFSFLGNLHIFIIINQEFPSLLWIFNWLLTVILIVGSRMMANVFFIENTAESRAIIYGAGSAGIQLAVALNHSSEMNPVCFID